MGVWYVNGGGNQNKEYGSLLTLPTKSTFFPLTIHIPLSCALISPSLPLPLLLSPFSTPPTVNNGLAWMTLELGTVSLNIQVVYLKSVWSQAKLYTLINKGRETLCVRVCINCGETLCEGMLIVCDMCVV